eukprot:Plantae.Rhodophyta-Hildenbrandia_rubra.ctg4918.p1 GENE.Plantae.Rhodophyta-Hildenbrandia_rubra.ctg4918~~Plantae.Rhodophyta-Hildenbrandia_rubra.ctg4918.p1  ORF type:complete len:466 (-),score=70.48 Plantae.Rhodophyta-Hildenbrandia_rubra.ctg4918:2264-3661(-)
MSALVESLSPVAVCQGNSGEKGVELSLSSPRDIKSYDRPPCEAPPAEKKSAFVESSDSADTYKTAISEADVAQENQFRAIVLEVLEDAENSALVTDTIVSCLKLAIKEQVIPVELKNDFAEQDGVNLVIKVARKGIGNRDIQVCVHKVICALSVDDTCIRERVGELQGIQLIIHAMLKYKQDVELLSGAMLTLLNLTPCIGNRALIGNFFGIEVTLSSMKMFQDECNLQRNGCALLANVTCSHQANKEIIVGVGGVKSILRAMKKCKHDSLVSFWGCLALRNLAYQYPEAKSKIGLQGGIRAILIALVTFKEDTDIQEQGCAALRNIAEGNEENQMGFVEMRGLEVLVRCMKRFRTIYYVHENSVALMKSIVKIDPLVAEKIASAGAVEAVLSAMIQYRPVQEIQRDCIVVLDAMARVGDDAKRKITSAGGVETINATLRVHLMQLDLVESGVALQRYLRGRERL